jgi:hypothetical protein
MNRIGSKDDANHIGPREERIITEELLYHSVVRCYQTLLLLRIMKWLCQQHHIHHLSFLSNGSTIDKTKVLQAAPLQVDTGIHSSIVQLLDTVKAHGILLEKGNGYNNFINKLSDVKRLRLTGRHSKE